MNHTTNLTILAALSGAGLGAQSYVDLVDSRGGAAPYSSVLHIEAGAIGAVATGDAAGNVTRGLDDDISWDAKVYYRDESVGSRRGTLEAYAGRDGMFAAFSDGKLVGDDTVARLEFHARPWMFYRDGFYDGRTLRQNGFYEGSDYEGYLGFGREASDGLYIEFGPFYRTLDFERSDLTPVSFRIPEAYNAYGGRLYLEQRSVQMDRRRGVPLAGSLLTLVGEREWNDSDGQIGTDIYSTRLPSAVYRVRGRLEWYIPGSDNAVWEVFANGGWQDEKDRVQNTEGQRPLGNIWADAQIRLRLHVGESITFTPFVHGQYSRVQQEDGSGSTKDFFLGAGAETWVHFSDSLSLHGWYSFLDNENRPSIRIDQDLRGEHMFYLGMVLRFGTVRR